MKNFLYNMACKCGISTPKGGNSQANSRTQKSSKKNTHEAARSTEQRFGRALVRLSER